MSGRPWSPEEFNVLRETYPNTLTSDIAHRLGRSVSSVYGTANTHGFKKSEEFLNGPQGKRINAGIRRSPGTEFKKGQAPANKGLRRPGWAPGRMRQTQFVKGNKPHTWVPVGSTRISKDGYLQRKIADTGCSPKDFIGEHILLWQEHHGRVPAGHAVCFRDGDKANITIGNLECISRRELMARNTVHRLPKELAEVIQLSGALKRKLRRIEREEQNDGLAQPSVRNAGDAEGQRSAHGD